MSRQDANAAFARTSFLYGGNAPYIEDLYARYQTTRNRSTPNGRRSFEGPEGRPDRRRQTRKARRGSGRTGRRVPRGDLVSALDGDWREVEKAVGEKIKAKAQAEGVELSAADVQQATRDSVHALMLIRAYRVRAATSTPISIRSASSRNGPRELDPRSYGFTDADLDRRNLLDHVLGLEFATLARSSRSCGAPTARRSASSSCTSPIRRRRAGSRSASKGPTRRSPSPARASARSSTSWSRPKASRSSATSKFTGTKRFGLDGGELMIPALEQIIKRGGALGVKDIVIGMAHRGRLNVLAQVMGKPHRAIFHEFKGGSSSPDDVEGSGDVKYHLGASSDREFDGNKRASLAHRQPVASRDRQSRWCSARRAPSRTSSARRAKTAPWRCRC